MAHAAFQPVSSIPAPQPVDPNKGPSEFNHHIAGWALVGVGLLVLASLRSPQLEAYHHIWPALFLLAGLFLALWSDSEIWPRGNLNWLWLLQHDAEARQHKIYSILLISIRIVEHFRMRGLLPRLWKTWAFPALAVIGAGMLLIHDHSGGSGAHSPEAEAYLVNPNLDVDGNPRGPSSLTALAVTHGAEGHVMDHVSGNAMDDSAMDPRSIPMDDHSQMTMEPSPINTAPASHHHEMTMSMLRVEREHFWLMIVGLCIVLFKFISDGEFFRSRIIPYLWPACMTLLGLMLVFYRE